MEVCCGALQHPEGVAAPAAQHDAAASSATSHQDSLLPLGPVPHMIRYAFLMNRPVMSAHARHESWWRQQHLSLLPAPEQDCERTL